MENKIMMENLDRVFFYLTGIYLYLNKSKYDKENKNVDKYIENTVEAIDIIKNVGDALLERECDRNEL